MTERGKFTDQQVEYLLRAPDRDRLGQLQGKSHLKAWDVRRWLIRVFGHGGWDQRITDVSVVAEWDTSEKKDNATKHYWHAIYRATVRLDVYSPDGLLVATYEDVATCDAKGPSRGDVHDQALKGAASQALKRCAVNLGDLFGLSLYNGGNLRPVVQDTVPRMAQRPQATPPKDDPVGEEHDPTVEGGQEEPPAEQQAQPEPSPQVNREEPTGTVLDRMTPEQRQQATSGSDLDPGVVRGRAPAQSPQRQADEASVIAGNAEAAAARGDVARVRSCWTTAAREGLLEVQLTQLDPEDPATLREALLRYGNAAETRRGSAHGEPAPEFGTWTGVQPAGQR